MRTLFLLLANLITFANATDPVYNAKVVGVTGTASIHGKPAKVGMPIHLGDTLSTGLESSLQIRTAHGSGFALNEKTSIVYTQLLDTIDISVVTGGVMNFVNPGTHWQVHTPMATAAVRGTAFYVHQDSARAYYCTCKGHVHYETKTAGPIDEITTNHKAFQFLPGSDSLRAAPLILHDDSTNARFRKLLE